MPRVKKIYEDTFYDCTALYDIYLPSTLKEGGVESGAFGYCENLSRVYFGSNSSADWNTLLSKSSKYYNDYFDDELVHYTLYYKNQAFSSEYTKDGDYHWHEPIVISGGKYTLPEIEKVDLARHTSNRIEYFSWNDDCTACKAYNLCTACGSMVNEEDGYVRSEVYQEATCTEPELTEFYATFYNYSTDYRYIQTKETLPHNYSKKIVTPDYFLTPATCTEKATYHYACERCNKSSCGDGAAAYEYGEPLGHDIVPNTDVKTGHHCIREGCDFTEAHSYTKKIQTDDYLASAISCTAPAVYYYACEVCGASSRGDTDATYSLDRVLGHYCVPDEDPATGHHCKRKDCDFKEEHTFSVSYLWSYEGVPTCTATAKCEICSYSYSQVASGDNISEKITRAADIDLNKKGIYTATFTDARFETQTSPEVQIEYSYIFTGSGTSKSPYLIRNITDLEKLSNDINYGIKDYGKAYFVLTADIGTNDSPVKTSVGSMDYAFSGFFDGRGHTVYLGIENHEQYAYIGLFGRLYEATVKNVKVMGSVYGFGQYPQSAGIAASVRKSVIENCENDAQIIGNTAGGIAVNFSGKMKNCINRGNVQGYRTGGLVSSLFTDADSSFKNCASTGDLYASFSCGGLVGLANNIGGSQRNYVVDNGFVFGFIGLGSGDRGNLTGYVGGFDFTASRFYTTEDGDTVGYGSDFTAEKVKGLSEAAERLNAAVQGSDGYNFWGVKGGKLCFISAEEYYYGGVSLTLSSDISINFYMNLTESEAQNGVMKFTVGGKTFTAKAKYNKLLEEYFFRCPLNVLQMASVVKAEFSLGEDTYEKEYSVKDYIEYITENSSAYSNELTKLCKKIADHGYYSQIYLEDIHDGIVIGEGDYPQMISYGTPDVEAAKSALSGYTLKRSNTNENIVDIKRSLCLDGKISMNFYLTVKDGYELKAQSVKVLGGKEFTFEKVSDNEYLITVLDIETANFADDYQIIADKEIITASVLSFANTLISGDSTQKAQNAMAALYEYYTAAKEFENTVKK